MKPAVDPAKCIACGQCISTVPEVFFMGDDGVANVKYEDAEGNATDFSLFEGQIIEAINGCPAQAISDLDVDQEEAMEAEEGPDEGIEMPDIEEGDDEIE